MLEDGGEVDNVFRNNLGALTKKVSTLISNDETDDEPSTFWITNPQVCTVILFQPQVARSSSILTFLTW